MKYIAFCLALIPAAAWAQDDSQPVTITPFEVLESHPQCKGPGQIALRVVFDAKGAKARVSHPDQDISRQCEIKTRRGNDLQRIAIPCPETDPQVLEDTAALKDLTRVADVSGEIVACLGVSDATIVEAKWSLTVALPQGPNTQTGDLSSPGLTVIYRGAKSGADVGTLTAHRAEPAVVAVFVDRLDLGLGGTGAQVSTYLALAPSEVKRDICYGSGRCDIVDVFARDLVQYSGSPKTALVVRFVEGR